MHKQQKHPCTRHVKQKANPCTGGHGEFPDKDAGHTHGKPGHAKVNHVVILDNIGVSLCGAHKQGADVLPLQIGVEVENQMYKGEGEKQRS